MAGNAGVCTGCKEDPKTMVWCGCGTGYPKGSFEAGYMEATGGLCEPCHSKPAAQQPEKPEKLPLLLAWRDWSVGDTVRYIGSGDESELMCHARMTIGSDYFIHEAPDEHESMLVLDDDGDEIAVLVGEFEFIKLGEHPAPGDHEPSVSSSAYEVEYISGNVAPASEGEHVETAEQGVNPLPLIDHHDDVSVDNFVLAMKANIDDFALVMKEKMARSRAKGRGGWERDEECTAEKLSALLRAHVTKGDPVDVANFCMMLHQRGESIVTAPLEQDFSERLDKYLTAERLAEYDRWFQIAKENPIDDGGTLCGA